MRKVVWFAPVLAAFLFSSAFGADVLSDSEIRSAIMKASP